MANLKLTEELGLSILLSGTAKFLGLGLLVFVADYLLERDLLVCVPDTGLTLSTKLRDDAIE